MKPSLDLKSALVRDKIDRALEALYLEAPRKESPQRVVCYDVHQKAKPQFEAAA